jgi:acetylornithine deacetylase
MLTSAEATVLDAIDRDAMLRDLVALIGIPSLGGEETPAQEWMAARLRDLGMEVDDWSIDFDALRARRCS